MERESDPRMEPLELLEPSEPNHIPHHNPYVQQNQSQPAVHATASERPGTDAPTSHPLSSEQVKLAPTSARRSENDTIILVAENEANNRRLIEHILGVAGYGYISATNGLEVLQILDTCRVDVVLLDLSMPLLDGYQTTQRIRQRPDGAKLPIVAVTAYAMSDDRERALRSGCTDYLAKPFRPNELLEVVRRMLHQDDSSHLGC